MGWSTCWTSWISVREAVHTCSFQDLLRASSSSYPLLFSSSSSFPSSSSSLSNERFTSRIPHLTRDRKNRDDLANVTSGHCSLSGERYQKCAQISSSGLCQASKHQFERTIADFAKSLSIVHHSHCPFDHYFFHCSVQSSPRLA